VFEQLLKALGVNRSCLVALDSANTNARLSARNVADVTVCNAAQLTCFEMLNHRFMVITKADLEAWINGVSSRTDKSAKKTEAA
jgi:large subunit ribosomal protein L4